MKKRIYKRYKKGKRGGQHYHVKSLESIINYGSRPRVIERLERDRHKALMRKEEVNGFFNNWPEYKMKSKKVKKIDILKDRNESIKRDSEAEWAPGMYLPVEKEIRLFPIKPDNIPNNRKERADKLYNRERFPAALVHELKHHETFDEDLEKVNRLPLDLEKKKKLLEDIQEDKAIKAEDEWLAKLKKRKGESK